MHKNKDNSMNLYEYFDHALREIYSLETMLESCGQQETADVLRSVAEMAYAKLSDLGAVLEHDIGQLNILCNEYGEPRQVDLSIKPTEESLQ